VIAALVGISGSTHIGRHVTIGGQAGTAGHLEIGDNVICGGRSGVTRSIPAGGFVSGYPARPHKDAMRQAAELARLSELRKKVIALEARLRKLENPA
jgi:UDP-3-O-[3-hydroxymyristoyl] glucosamine N-acyltransferase